ncbi:MAG TPA: CRTAC1 family protein [Candidatus Polarisedimenticolia bacterium]|nr:CRTAC1 family protein [Candidatus Polarisedimenticolia bacterium]
MPLSRSTGWASAACAAALLAAVPAVSVSLRAAGETAAARPSAVRYTDVTAQAGLDVVHAHGGTGKKYYIETVPPGVCWLDYDRDGWQDLYFVQSGPLPGAPRPPGSPHSRLFRNRGDGTFVDVTDKAGVANAAGYGNGCTVGDYDNDGDEDLYVTNFGPSVLYRNNGDGTFTDVTRTAGVRNGLYAASAAWADYDNDGRLDLYVANYVDFTMDDQKFCGDVKKNRRSYCHPDAFGGLPDVLYHNEGNGTFKEVAKASGIWDPNGKSLGVVWFDYDADGDVDLYVANDATPNMLYRNDGNGRFTDITLLAGVCCSEDGKAESGMGTDAGDADGDGWPDLFVTNLSNEVNQLYHNIEGKGTFSIETFPAGLGEVSLLTTGWGTDFYDYDNDGDLDLIVTNGHPMDDINLVSDIISYAQNPFLFENLGRGNYREIGREVGEYFKTLDVGRGLATADYDNDGDLDVVFTPNNRKATLLRNDGGAAAGHWITLRLEGVACNRDAIGARVVITAGGRRQEEEVRSASSYLSQNDLRLHFGLGSAGSVDRIEIRWPEKGKKIETLGPIAADQFLTIREGRGVVARSLPGAPVR